MSKKQKIEKARLAFDQASANRASDLLPSPHVERRFREWSDALLTLVSQSLRLAEGEWIDEWQFDPDCEGAPVFAFHFNQRVYPLGHSRSLFVRANMRVDLTGDLDTELRRLQLEVSEYRKCVTRMYDAGKRTP